MVPMERYPIRIIPYKLFVDIISSMSSDYLENSEKIKCVLTNENVFAGRYGIPSLKAEEAL